MKTRTGTDNAGNRWLFFWNSAIVYARWPQ